MMRTVVTASMLLLPLALLAGCSRAAPERDVVAYGAAAPRAVEEQRSAPAGNGDDAGLGAMLAYEHGAGIQLQADRIPERQQAVQAACGEGRFGACVVLNVHQQGGDWPSASVTLRIVPEGVEPMIALAGEGARLGSRSIRAEDLAVVVRDNAVAQDRLRRELVRLQEFQQRRDLSVADVIALSERIASAEAQLEAVERQAAQHRRRIDTQLLTLDFRPPEGQARRSEVGQALRDVGATLAMGTAWTIRALAFLAPLALVLAILVLAIWRIRRRRP